MNPVTLNTNIDPDCVRAAHLVCGHVLNVPSSSGSNPGIASLNETYVVSIALTLNCGARVELTMMWLLDRLTMDDIGSWAVKLTCAVKFIAL